MENIVKTFPGVKALNNAAITVHAGEVMGFMGENGAGKSTLMNVLGGVFPADSGEIYIEGKKVEIEGGSNEEIKLISVPLSIIFIIGGAAAIAFGGDLTVDAASRIASDLGMTQTLIGLTIVSIGTSLPELVTSIVAARKNEVDMALGNAIGSNVFNILMVLGIASAISPISIITENIIDLCVLIAFTVCVWIFAGSKKKIGRVEGFCMVALYAAYAVYIIIR